MPADLISLSADDIRNVLGAEPNENWDKFKRTPRPTYTPPDWLTGKKAADHTVAWAAGLRDAAKNGDLKGVAGTLFSAPLNFADFLPSPEEISAGEDDLARMGYQDENS